MGYRFFVSYARADPRENEEIEEFVDDLSAEVVGAVGRNGGEPAFFDRHIEPARDWSEAILNGLCTSKALICLISESYVASNYCGREFSAFSQRLKQANALAADLIIPVIWRVVSRELPPPLAALQNDHIDFPRTYKELGLVRLKRKSRYHDDYMDVVEKLADVIVKNTTRSWIADTNKLPPLLQTPNAFQPGDAVPTVGPIGPKNAKFVYVVAAPHELPPQKEARAAYGDEGGYWWCPYQPPEELSIGAVATDAALQSQTRYGELAPSDDLPSLVEVAARNNTPVAILVDPWSLMLEKYERLARSLRALAAESPVVDESCGVFVSWNSLDADTGKLRQRLEDAVRMAFTPEAGKTPRYYFPRLETLTDFRDQLVTTLREIKMRIMEKTDPARAVGSGTKLHSLTVPGDSGT